MSSLPTREVLVLSGVQAYASIIGKPFADEFGAVCIDYFAPPSSDSEMVNPQATFDPDVTGDRILAECEGLDQLTLILISAGGFVGYDAITQKVRKQYPDLDIRIIIIDAPGKPGHILNPFAPLIRFIPDAKVWNKFTKLWWRFSFNEPKNVQPGIYLKTFKRHCRESKRFPLRVWFAQVRYLMRHSELAPGSLAGCKVCILVSTDDNFVRNTARYIWALVGTSVGSIDVPSTHAGTLDFAQVWIDAVRNALYKLDNYDKK